MSTEPSEEYKALIKYGFSAFKAAEIELDAKRGDEYAKSFIKLAKSE